MEDLDVLTCPFCDAVNRGQWEFCPECGNKIQALDIIPTKHKWLGELLARYPIEDEKVIFEISINKIQNKETEACFFATDYRCGFVEKGLETFFYKSILAIRNVELNLEEQAMTVNWLTKEKFKLLEADDVFKFEAPDFSDLVRVNYYIWYIRYEIPNPLVQDYFDQIYVAITLNEIDKAIDLVYTASQLDPMTGVNDILVGRTLKAAGREAEAVVYAAKRWDLMAWLAPEIIIKEYLWYDWHTGAIRYLPERTNANVLESFLIDAVIAKAHNNLTEYIQCLAKIFTDKEMEPGFLIPLTLKLAEMADAQTNHLIIKVMKDVLNGFISKAGNIEEKTKLNEALAPFFKIVEYLKALDMPKMHSMLKAIYTNTPETNAEFISYLLLEENYTLAAQHVFERERYEHPEYWGAEEALSLDGEIWGAFYESDLIEHQAYQIFASLRLGKDLHDLQQQIKLLKNSKGFKACERVKDELTLFVCMTETEIAIKMGQTEKAIAIWNDWEKCHINCIGMYFVPVLRYAKEIGDIFKAVALGSERLISEALNNLPNIKPFEWIHGLGFSYKKDLPRVEEASAVNYLYQLDDHMKMLLEFTKIDVSIKKEIQNYRDEMIEGMKVLDSSDTSKKKKIKIALAGETSSGKSTFLNRLFNTNMFFATQEEATGVPTEVHYGKEMSIEVWNNEGVCTKTYNVPLAWLEEDKIHLNEEYLPVFCQIMAELTRVDSAYTKEGGKIKLFAPLFSLPEDVVLIDTPGFNANQQRSDIATKVIADSHVCLFVIDARNALKGQEMKMLSSIREEVGKTFLVLNKMDLVLGDDELDCDGLESAEMTVKRVQNDLAKYLNVDNVMVYPVCSLDKTQVSLEAQSYVKNFEMFMQHVMTEAKASRAELLVHSFAKVAVELTGDLLERVERVTLEYNAERKKLESAVPLDLSLFGEEIMERIKKSFLRQRTAFIEEMSRVLNSELDDANQNFIHWLNLVSSGKDLKNNVKSQAEEITSCAIKKIEAARREELMRIRKHIHNEISVIFRELYRKLPFPVSFDDTHLMAQLPKLEEAQNAVQHNWGNIDYEGSAGLGVFIGAGIGTAILGPVGAVIGSFIGGMLGGKDLDEVRGEVHAQYYEALDTLWSKLADSLERDITPEELSSFFAGLHKVVINQLDNYYTAIANEINSYTLKDLHLEREMIHLKKVGVKIEECAVALKNWRAQRLVSK